MVQSLTMFPVTIWSLIFATDEAAATGSGGEDMQLERGGVSEEGSGRVNPFDRATCTPP
jgi:hypothetical protein